MTAALGRLDRMKKFKPMLNRQALDELKARLADRFTAAELADLLDISVEDLIEEYIDRILRSPEVLEVVGYEQEETED